MLNFSKLNEAQRRAVTHPGGPAIVLAGPGSGKTFLIVSRIMYLIEYRKVPPDTILVITFTKAAAYSMQHRFEESTGGKYVGVRFGTFHSFFYQILKEYDSYNNNSLFENEEKKQYLKNIFIDLGLNWDDSVDFDSFINNPSQCTPEGLTEEQARLVTQRLKAQMRIDKRLDFDDMSELVLNLLKNKPKVLEELQNKYKYIFVDEYQDTNQGQEDILQLLSAPQNEIMVVGDDDQAIYGFRGSKPEVMKNFRLTYPKAKVYFLEINYRSTPQIVCAATAVINENKNRFQKDLKSMGESGERVCCIGLRDKDEEFTYILKRLLELHRKYGISFSDMAIITRTNREQEALSLFLQKRGISCCRKEMEKRLSEHFVVKEILGCLEFIVGIRDRAPGLWNKMNGDENRRKMIAKQVPLAAMRFICNVMGYEKILKDQAFSLAKKEGIKAEVWLEEWQNILLVIKENARNYKSLQQWVPNLRSFLEKQKQENYSEGVHILTMHGAKGLEFSYVCIPDANEGNIPGKRCRKETEIEEERRLFYVAMTRAKKVLDILYLTGTPDYPRLPSRFLNPLLKNKKYSQTKIYSSPSTNSSNSTLSKNSSNASATVSYSSSSSMKISSGSTLGSLSSSR